MATMMHNLSRQERRIGIDEGKQNTRMRNRQPRIVNRESSREVPPPRQAQLSPNQSAKHQVTEESGC